jgi:hypothetical protein
MVHKLIRQTLWSRMVFCLLHLSLFVFLYDIMFLSSCMWPCCTDYDEDVIFKEDKEEDETYFFAGQGTPRNSQKSKHSFTNFLSTRNTSTFCQKEDEEGSDVSTISTWMSKRTVSLMSWIHMTRFTLMSRQSLTCYRRCRTMSTATQRNSTVNPMDSVVGVERFIFQLLRHHQSS